MDYSPNGPYQPGKEPFPDESGESDVSLASMENVSDMLAYRQRKLARGAVESTKDTAPIHRQHPAGRRGNKTVEQTLRDAGLYRPDGDEPA